MIAVGQAAAAVGHPHGDRQRQQHVEHQDGCHHRQRGRQPGGEEVAHRLVGGPALAPVEADDLLDEDPQLHPHGFVQAQLLADGFDLFLAGVQAAQHLGRVAAEVLEEEEHQQHHAGQRGDHLPQAPDEVCRHGFGSGLVRPASCKDGAGAVEDGRV
jgi:hypothetical protein